MARGVHRHRMLRLSSLARTKIETREAHAPVKRAETARRDVRMRTALKAGKDKDLNPAVISWACRLLNKEWRQVTEQDLKALAG